MAKRKSRKTRPQRPESALQPGTARPARAGKAGHVGRRPAAPDGIWLYGSHAVLEALGNPRRRVKRLLVTGEAAKKLGPRLESLLATRSDAPAAERATPEVLGRFLPEYAVHQGVALSTEPLARRNLIDLLATPLITAPENERPRRFVIVALDQVTDPQNVGAILRSAAAFGAAAVLAPRSHAAPETGALAKAASGALEHVTYLQVGNLAQAFDQLKDAGFWILGLAGDASLRVAEPDLGDRVVLVMGAEGRGLRRLTRERCDLLARLPTRGPIDQLNVSNAAAVALYELLGRPAP